MTKSNDFNTGEPLSQMFCLGFLIVFRASIESKKILFKNLQLVLAKKEGAKP